MKSPLLSTPLSKDRGIWERVIIPVILLLFALLFLSFAELIFPITKSISFDVIATGKEIISYRRRIKAEEALLRKKAEVLSSLEKEVAGLEFVPPERYLVVDLLGNRLFLKKGEEILREMVVSTGRGDVLVHKKRRWVFKTPTGVLRILRKIKSPIWYKPDWAFIEEKKPIPPPHAPERRVRGMLGDYALDLGGGILIHGTPYEHLLGRSVTHGCIRVGKEDMKFLFENSFLGMNVYIYGK